MRQERQQSSENHSFKPQINSRPAYLDKRTGSAGGSTGGDSLDHLTANSHNSADVFEQPLPGGRGGYQLHEERNDSLGQEVKKFPVGRGNKYDTKADLEYKSQFLSQYEKQQSTKNQMAAQPYALEPALQPVVKDSDNAFMSSLRGGDDGGGWNNDTSFGGFEAVSSRVPRKSPSAIKSAGPGRSDVAQARSRLSLLKSKIQKHSAAPASDISNSSLLRSNSAHNLDDESDNAAFKQHSDPNPHRSGGRVPRRRHDNERTEVDNPNENLYPKSASFQQQPKPTPSNKENGHSSSVPVQSRAPRRPSDGGMTHAKMQEHASQYDDYSTQEPYDSAKSSYATARGMDGMHNEEEEYGGQQLECPDCHRKFNPIPYEKHVKICAKVFKQKRKVFDSSKMRVDDIPELAKLLQQKKKEEALEKKRQRNKARLTAEETTVGGAEQKKAKWKAESNAFRDAMRAARNAAKAEASGAPLPPMQPSAPDPSLIPCPHCGRRFSEKAGERHIPQCQNIRAKPTSLKRGTGGAGGKIGSSAPTPVPTVRPVPKRR